MNTIKKAFFTKNKLIWLGSMIITIFVTLLPLYIMIKYSISDRASWTTGGKYPVPWWPFEPTFENIIYYLNDQRFWRNALMSVQIAFLTVFICVIVGVPAAYSLTRHKFPAIGVLMFSILSIRMIPDVAAAIPITELFATGAVLGWIPVQLKIAMTHSLFGLPYMIFVTQGLFETIPVDLDEQAHVLGASKAYTFIRIIAPLALPGIAASAIYVFMLSWNEFLYAYFITNASISTSIPLSVSMSSLFGTSSPNPAQLSVISLIISVPVLVFTFIVQKYIIAGMTAGSVK